ncbi:type III pantothenate kinase [Lishizhenia tianjinensis]|uniref:Type III pantothenate kinase n=1 Tax=Lishizhenia tianjinensis TaxID=477690 RepID=A0A1I6ZY87_9FLAO|nr:type III pantothenate kinase [Lishizhenia tianjinensis]SFT67670.1 type III pantothenate kinase [Lishizhenia tianjinensis]
MEKEETNLIIDAGNTRVKVVEIQGDEVRVVAVVELEALDSNFLEKKLGVYQKSLLSSVLSTSDTKRLVELFRPYHVLSSKTELPFLNKYRSETLGADRAANAAFAFSEVEKRKTPVLVVDLGTCVKFDFVNEKGEYLGGSISPGLQMRYKSMHTFTGRLPLLNDTGKTELIGNTTLKSMWSGVMNGMHAEIQGMIAQYEEQYAGLTTFMTGGDAKLFDIEAKNYIFVNENLTLQGLNIILEHNAK